MLAYLSSDTRGEAARLLALARAALEGRGARLAGAVQVNTGACDLGACDMDLHVLSTAAVVRISQNLGALASGCRLDPDGVARAAALTETVLEGGADAVLINKFGKAEAEGRGFRDVMARALAMEVPVLITVAPGYLAEFATFAGGLETRLPAEDSAILAWCDARLADLAA